MIKNMIKPQTLKGFRDFLPKEAKKRQYVIDILKKVFESYGFEPLETPALETLDLLKGKYGEEEKLIYSFKTRGEREVALRYDQTVPLVRVIAQYPELPKPFKRYQIQNVWRGERPQKGRYREFIQCDADIVGSNSPIADAEIISLVLSIYKTFGLDVTIKINDRENFADLDKKYISAIDKLEKIGESAVLSEMVEKGMADKDAKEALVKLQNKELTESLKRILEVLEKMGVDMSKIKYEPTLARGLGYYTGIIFETVCFGSSGSICSGGRWDKMIGNFSGQDQPAVGFGLGFDRTIEVLEEKNLIPNLPSSSKVLVTIFPASPASGVASPQGGSKELIKKSIDCSLALRSSGVSTELYLDENTKMEKQLKYADKRGIPYAIIIGPEEAKNSTVTLRNMKTREQETLDQKNLVSKLV